MLRNVPILLSVLFVWLIGAAATAEYPLAYVGYPDARDMSLSPDGGSVATLMTDFEFGIRSRRDWDVIEFRSAETGDVTYTHDLDDRLYYWVSWPFDDVVLAQTLKYDIGRRKVKTQIVILAINPVTGKERTLFSGSKKDWKKEREAPKISGISIESREIALEIEHTNRVDLVAVNVDTGKSRTLDRGNRNTVRWELGPDLEPILRFDQGRRENEELVYIKAANGRWVLRQSYNVIENNFRPASSVSEDGRMLVVHRPDGADRVALYTLNFETNAYEEVVYENPIYDLVTTRRTSFGGRLLYVGWFEDQLEKKWFDDNFEAAGTLLDKALKPEDNWSILETSESERQWLIYVSSPTRPGAYMHFDLDRKRLRVLANQRPDLKPNSLSPMQRVDYHAADGTPLFGYFTPSLKRSNAPLVVMPHGGPVARDYADFDGMAQFLAFKGYHVFQPQFRGGGGLGRSFEIAGHGEWGRDMQTDIEDGVDALIEQGLVASNAYRSILGMSYGGYAAMAGATLTPDNYLCAVSINGVSDLPMMLASYDHEDAIEKDVYDIWVKRIGDPNTQLDQIMQVSPRHQVGALKAQVLLIHGSDDSIVSVQQSRAMYQSIIDAGKYAMYHELEGAGHQIYNQEQRTEMLVMIDRFLSRCMPTR